MMLRYARTENPSELTPEGVTARFLVANFGAFHQTSVLITNIIFNMLDSDAEFNTISVLRDEISKVLHAHGGTWSKATIAKMVCTDSIMRGTLRLDAYGNSG